MNKKSKRILFECNYFTITKREALVSIIIICVLVGISMLISSTISNKVDEHNSKINRTQVCETKEMFRHLYNTNAGDIISNADVVCTKPVSIDKIKGKYSYIVYKKEEYTRHTRLVPIRSGKTTTYITEVYYTWDAVDYKTWESSDININDIPCKTKKIKIFFNAKYLSKKDYNGKSKYQSGNEIYLTSSTRVSYKVGGLKSAGVVYCNLRNNSINDISYYINSNNPQREKELLLYNPTAYIVTTWITAIVLICIIVFIFVYFDNSWLYSRKELSENEHLDY